MYFFVVGTITRPRRASGKNQLKCTLLRITITIIITTARTRTKISLKRYELCCVHYIIYSFLGLLYAVYRPCLHSIVHLYSLFLMLSLHFLIDSARQNVHAYQATRRLD